jgi:putative transposase
MKTNLEYGKYYHIFNRGNNHENIFIETEDYIHFLDRLDVYIGSVADIFAWALLRNHFHLLIRIKEEDEIGYFNSDDAKSENPDVKWRTHFPLELDKRFVKKPNPIEQFKHFFNAYSRWFNKRHERSGSLFQKNYERKEVNHDRYFTNLVVYIHTNPVRHGFVDHILDYPWTSHLILKADTPTKLNRNEVVRYFNDMQNFEYMHTKPIDENDERIEGLIIE